MPYPESCPECGGAFRNTGTHFTARRNEVGRHVLLELGCQNTSRRFWWDFTSGNLTEDGQAPAPRHAASSAAATNGSLASHREQHAETNGHAGVATMDPPVVSLPSAFAREPHEVIFVAEPIEPQASDAGSDEPQPEHTAAESETTDAAEPINLPATPAANLKEAFIRQLQLDRLTLRQMRSWLMSDEARRAIEVAAGATEATYERLALILFGAELPQLLGKQAPVPSSTVMSAEERLELQREKARIRARVRRAAAKAARQAST
jgi:hypothetical protein